MDTFDFARRAELLGIGRWGNKMSSYNGAWGRELASALIEVLLGVEANRMKEKARRLAVLCNKNNGGRDIAARIILKEIGEEATETGEIMGEAELNELDLTSEISATAVE
jgi:hypothetical protein